MRKLLVLLVAMFGLVACSSGGQTSLSPQDFQALTTEPGVVTVDVRTPAEYASGHLQNAINLDVESPDFAGEIAGMDPNVTYAVYCRSGNRSKTAMQQMSDVGFTSVKDLDGGIVAWQSDGLPVTTG